MSAQLPHHTENFGEFIEEVAGDDKSRLRAASMVEKDYWITHALWSMERGGVPFVFKGGTALSKAMGITNRFSEDLDLIVDAPSGWDTLPAVSNWHAERPTAIASRRAYWEAYVGLMAGILPDFVLEIDEEADEQYRNVKVRAKYPGSHTDQLAVLGSSLKPFVLLELAFNDPERNATEPSLARELDSEVHAALRRRSASVHFQINRPTSVRCVHPILTLWEKLDAVARRYHRPAPTFDPTAFVRHYEDVARIILREQDFPLTNTTASVVRDVLFKGRHIRKVITATDDSLVLADKTKQEAVDLAYKALGPMYWQDQMPLTEALETIKHWLGKQPLPSPGTM